jgi:Glyoxalase-like domain
VERDCGISAPRLRATVASTTIFTTYQGGLPCLQGSNRVHIDLVNPDPSAIDELVRLGATVVENHTELPGHPWTVLQDPEGNEFCIAAKSFTGWD